MMMAVRQLMAILGDSFRESMDRRSLLCLLVLSSLLILFCFSVSFEGDSVEKVLAEQTRDFAKFERRTRVGEVTRSLDVRFSTSGIRPVAERESLPPELRGGHEVTLTFETAEGLDELVRAWESFRKDGPRLEPVRPEDRGGAAAPDPAKGPPLSPEERIRFLEERFREFGYNQVHAAPVDGSETVYRVAVRSDYPFEVAGAHRMGVLFGLLHLPLGGTTVAEAVVTIQLTMASTFAGFIGMLIAVIVCASFVPNLLAKGTVDLVLARPIGRARLLCYKYLGGLSYISILAAWLIGGCWLGLSIRTGYFNPWFLACILTVMATFAVIYSVTVLFGVWIRSGGVSALLTFGVWGLSGIVVGLRHNLKHILGGEETLGGVQTALNVAYAILPKTGDLDILNLKFLSRSHLSDAAFQRIFAEQVPEVDWTFSIGTTAIFATVMVGLAVVIFRRRDY